MQKVWIYSNFGYQLLGHIIERVSGMSYEDFVKKHIWSPIGINDIQVARPTLSQKSRLIYWFERIFFSNNFIFYRREVLYYMSGRKLGFNPYEMLAPERTGPW